MRTGRHGHITHHINANKQFKRDSQRLAFLLLLQIKCLWHNALGIGDSVAHPLIGRYTNACRRRYQAGLQVCSLK